MWENRTLKRDPLENTKNILGMSNHWDNRSVGFSCNERRADVRRKLRKRVGLA